MAPGWSDLGSWDALAAMVGTASPIGPITTVDCESCYIRSDGVQVAALGVRDLIIVASGGRLLIMPRGRSQEVKKLLSAMDFNRRLTIMAPRAGGIVLLVRRTPQPKCIMISKRGGRFPP